MQQEEKLTRSRLETTWKNVFPTVMPKAVLLNEGDPSYEWLNDPEIGLVLDQVFETEYIIPFVESVQQFLSIKATYDAICDISLTILVPLVTLTRMYLMGNM
jgi:hypothetical protein